MRDNIHAVRLTRSRRVRLPAITLLLAGASVAGCTAGSGGPAGPAATATARPSAASAAGGCLSPPASCYAPRLFQVAYSIAPLLDQGIDGRGETVTVLAAAAPSSVQAPGNSGPGAGQVQGGPTATDIRQDLAAFDSQFRLAASRIQAVTGLAGPASGWQAGDEEVQDVEIVHALAPAAALRVVVLPVTASATKATAAMLAGLRLALSGTDVALIGRSLGEHFFTRAQVAAVHSVLRAAEARHVTVIAGSGDNGGFSEASFGGTAVAEVSLPASDPLVLSVGGTTLTANPATGAYTSETAWNGQDGFSISSGASGGGFSHLYARPGYQDGVAGTSAMRGVPDVAADADSSGGMPVIEVSGAGAAANPATGTGAAASVWAAVMALADQYAHRDLGFVNPAIYHIASGASYHQAFNDVTAGSSVQTLPYPGGTAGYHAGPGWDPATGWGSPDAQALVPLLAA